MKTNSLAAVLVKVLGLSLTISGIVPLISGLIGVLWFELNQPMNRLPNVTFLWQMFSNYGVAGVLHLGIGLYLIKKASSIVEKFLNICADE